MPARDENDPRADSASVDRRVMDAYSLGRGRVGLLTQGCVNARYARIDFPWAVEFEPFRLDTQHIPPASMDR